MGVVLAIGLPLLAAMIWGVFGTLGDTRGQGGAPVPVSGKVRFVIETGFFVLATLAFAAGGAPDVALVFGVVALLLHIIGYERMLWLLQH